MKRIVIYQENIEPIVLNDDDNSQISSYVENLSKLLDLKRIVTIQTTDKALVVRPTKIVSISISETDEKIENRIEEDVIRDE
jgi:hypothetical protein